MAHEKPHNNDGWFDPHPGADFVSDTVQQDDQACALAVDTTALENKNRRPGKQVKNHPE
ncbi:MAG: hypothetical protein GY869_26965 [Planctomycetes bacterium]|nr:hypothetical protein [Planctomycetota bacterium]